MAESQSRLEITPKVIGLGDKVVQLQHVVSAGLEAVHPFRLLGLLLSAAGVALIGNEVMVRGLEAFKLQAAGSLPLWFGFGAGGIGLFLILYARPQLTIRTSDGSRIAIRAGNDEAADLMLRIRHAIEAPTRSGDAEMSALAQRHLGVPQQATRPNQRSQGAADTGPPHTNPVGRRPDGYTNGHAGRGQGAPDPEPSRRVGPALHATAREPLSLPATVPAGTAREDGAQDLAALMEHVRRADVQHKEALIDLLRVVEDYYRGRANREDAVAHWRSFADYVVQYLSDVDGLISHTERFGRHMLR